MKLNNKEKYIKQVLENQDSPVDSSALWDAIEERVPDMGARPQRRWWMLLFPFCLGAIVISSIWYWTSQQPTLSSAESIGQQDATQRSQTQQSQIIPSESSEVTKDSSRNSELEVKGLNVKGLSSQIEDNLGSSITQIKSQNLINQSKVQIDVVQTNTSTLNQSLTATQKWGQDVQRQSTTILENQRQAVPGTPNNLKLAQTPIALLSGIDSEARPLIQFASGIQSLKLKLITLAKPVVGSLFLSRLTSFDESQFDKLKPTWSLMASTGVNLVNSKVSLNQNSNLRQVELENETGLLGYQAGIGLQRLSSKGWSLRSQFGLATHVTRYQSDEEIRVEGTVESSTEIYNGSSVNSGTVVTFTQVNQDIIWHRSHQQYNLDLLLGKQFDLNPRLSVLAEIGMLNTLYQVHHGYYFANATPAFTKITDNNDHPYATGYRLNGALGASILYQLNNRFSIGLGTSAVLPFDLINESEYYQSKKSQLRFDLAIGYQLN